MRRRKFGIAGAVLSLVACTAGVASTAGASSSAAKTTASHRAVAAQTSPVGPFTVNNNDRESVRQFYNQVYQASSGVTDGWSGGSIAGCVPGSVSSAFLAAALSRINYYRTMADVPDVTFAGTTPPANPWDPTVDPGSSTDPTNALAQAAALMEAANPPNGVGHTPSQAGTNCWTQQAFNGSSTSNLDSGGSASVEAGAKIDDLMVDDTALGHRRNMLDPSIWQQGAGAVPVTTGAPTPFFTQEVLTTPLATRPTLPTAFQDVAWPSAGYVPYEIVPARWSFSLPNANFDQATVTMSLNGASVPAQVLCSDPPIAPNDLSLNCSNGVLPQAQFSDPAIVWRANNTTDGVAWPKPTADDPYVVTIKNVLVNGVAQNFTYTVTVMDPAVQTPTDTITQTPTGPSTATVGADPTYSVPALSDPNISGYQWSTTPVTPGNLFDNSENGLSNWTANLEGNTYNPISTAESDGGTSSFHLANRGPNSAGVDPPQQTLTLNQTLVPNASSQLTFDNFFAQVFGTVSVDVSTDGGVTWTPAWSDTPPDTEIDTAFAPQTVSLAQYAGQQIQLRFDMTTAEWFSGPFEPQGWYFDNVQLSNVQDAGTPTLSAVSPTPSFVFDNAQAGPEIVQVRPQWTGSFGSAFNNWSPSLAVTSNPAGASSTSLTSSSNPSTGKQQVTYTAAVTGTNFDGGGTVSFTDGGTAISGCQSLALTTGQATCAQTYTEGATHAIVATYSGDPNFTGSTSPTVNQIVNAVQATTVTLSSSAISTTTGHQVTFTATVSPTDGGGTVDFEALEDSGSCPAAPLNAAGQATCVMTFSNPRVESDVLAIYSGDANFGGNGSNDVQESVSEPTSTSVTSSVNPATIGQAVTYTATVSGDSFLGNGTVSFTDGSVPISGCQSLSMNLGTPPFQATCTQTYGSNGAHSIVATFSGYAATDQFAPSDSIPLSQSVGTLGATSTSLSSSANPSTTGQQVTYTATVSGSDGGGSVLFTDNGNPIAGCTAQSLTAGQATCTQTYADVGSHPIVATYSGDTTSAGSSSAVVTQAVNLVPPAAPANVAAVNIGNGAAQVAFNGGTTGSPVHGAATTTSTVTGFDVYEGTSSGHESTTPVNPNRIWATARGFTVTGLTLGKKYYFTVKAMNAAGLSAASKQVSATAAAIPAAPRNLAAKSGKESAVLTWKAPASDGGSAVTGYDVYEGTFPRGESATPVNAKPLSAKTTSDTVTRLTDGTTYFFTVRAINAVGTGGASSEASTTPATLPGPPNSVVAYPSTGSAIVRWAASGTDGGSPITGYDVYKGTKSHDESATPVNKAPLPFGTTDYTVSGLTDGTKYYFTVKALNTVGASAASAERSATPAKTTPPGPPGSLSAGSGNRSAALTWKAANSAGGKPITGYDVYKGTVSGGESATPVNKKPLSATATSYTVTALTNAVPYYFTVRAINSVGLGVPSNEASTVPN